MNSSCTSHPLLLPSTIVTDTDCRDRNDPVYRAALIEECGDRGVLDVPEGKLESETRHCAGFSGDNESPFPVGRYARESRASTADGAATEIFGRAARQCWHGKSFGCTKKDGEKRCWRKCGKGGEWCWLTVASSTGPWALCDNDDQCKSSILVCSSGCSSCGCGC
jgi:hypothetical protein